MSFIAQEINGGKFAEIGDGTAVLMTDEDSLPPTICPDLIPAGWHLATEEPMDFEFQNGDWREVYILERDA